MDRKKKKTTWKVEKQGAPIVRKTYRNPDHPVGFAGAKPLVDVVRVKGVKPPITQKWLESQLTYTFTKLPGGALNTIGCQWEDEQWQADLVDVQALKRDNDGHR